MEEEPTAAAPEDHQYGLDVLYSRQQQREHYVSVRESIATGTNKNTLENDSYSTYEQNRKESIVKRRRNGTFMSGATSNTISGKPIIQPDGSVLLLQSAELEIVKEILKKTPEQRTLDELQQLLPLFKNIKFFKEQNILEADLPEIVQCLTIEQQNRGTEVFEYGSVGEKFYMILDGQVGVIIPNPQCKDFERWYQQMLDERQWQKDLNQILKSIEQCKKRLEATAQYSPIKKKAVKTSAYQMEVKELEIINDKQQPIFEFTPEQLHLFDEDDYKRMKPNLFHLRELQRSEYLQRLHTQMRDKIFVIRKNDKTVPMFIEVCKLEPGKAFGEQALLKNNEPALRAATIKCTKDSTFAVMAKEDFQNILKNKIRKSKLDQMEVLQSLPFFRVWTKTQLLKLVNFILQPKQYVKNQVVYSEGERTDTIYIIKSGEFEVTRKYYKDIDYAYDKNKINIKLERQLREATANSSFQRQTYGGRNDESMQENSARRKQGGNSTSFQNGAQQGRVQMAKQVRNIQSFKLALLGPGQLFGDDDVLFDRPHSSTIICRSATGILIQMNGMELLKKMKGNDECWNIFQNYIQNKEQIIGSRLYKIDYVYHKEPVKIEQSNSKEKVAKLIQQNQQLYQQKYPSLNPLGSQNNNRSSFFIESANKTPLKVLNQTQSQISPLNTKNRESSNESIQRTNISPPRVNNKLPSLYETSQSKNIVLNQFGTPQNNYIISQQTVKGINALNESASLGRKLMINNGENNNTIENGTKSASEITTLTAQMNNRPTHQLQSKLLMQKQTQSALHSHYYAFNSSQQQKQQILSTHITLSQTGFARDLSRNLNPLGMSSHHHDSSLSYLNTSHEKNNQYRSVACTLKPKTSMKTKKLTMNLNYFPSQKLGALIKSGSSQQLDQYFPAVQNQVQNRHVNNNSVQNFNNNALKLLVAPLPSHN